MTARHVPSWITAANNGPGLSDTERAVWLQQQGYDLTPEQQRLLAVSAPPKRRTLKMYDDDELIALPEPMWDWLGLIARNSLVQIFGPYGSFKSFLALLLAFHRQLGMELNGAAMTRGPVFYIVAEGAVGMRVRMAALRQFAGVGRIGLHFIPHAVHLSDPAQTAGLVDAIKAHMAGGDEPWLIVDTRTRCMTGNENQTEDIQAFVRGCDTIRQQTKATVIVLHHPGWQNEDRGRGGYDFDASCDTIMKVERDDDRLTLSCIKQKDGPEFAPLTFETVPIGGSLVLKPVEPGKGPMTANERKCLTVVPPAEDGAGVTFKQVMDAAELPKSSASRALKALESRGYAQTKLRSGKRTHVRTASGNAALVPQFQAGSTEVPTVGVRVVPPVGGVYNPHLEPNPALIEEGE